MSNTLAFHIDPSLIKIGITGEFIAMRGLTNRDTDPEFEEIKKRELEAVLSELNFDSLDSDPILQGFRALHKEMGCANRKNIPAPENLLKLFAKTGDLPHVNLLVDIYNLISIKTRLALGAHNIDKIDGGVTLRPTDGTESFWPIGSPEPKSVKSNEYSYVDDANDIICRLEVRQVEKTKATLDIRNCFYIIQGNRATSPEYLNAATKELIELTTRFCGGEVETLYRP
jgi:DNA/RNA-binding domain of Phe-tRNA-synthetase-like protein